MARTATLPVLNGESGLSRYLAEIRKFPMLEPQQEYMFAKRWREHDDRDAAHHLVTSHLRLVAKIAMGYRGYGLPISEVVSEGNVGLMQAVKRFEPEKGFRLATYAMWWIKASIQEYILRSWSLVKMGTTANQKKLFFNLRKAKSKISALDEGDLRPDQVAIIAKRLGVTNQDVVDMNRRLGGDASLNAPIRDDGEAGEWQDWLVDNSPNQEAVMAEHEEFDHRRQALNGAIGVLNPRERRIFEARRLAEDPMTLEDLAAEFGVSRERVRQIEVRAFEKVQSAVKGTIARQEAKRKPRSKPRTDRAVEVTDDESRRQRRLFVFGGCCLTATAGEAQSCRPGLEPGPIRRRPSLSMRRCQLPIRVDNREAAAYGSRLHGAGTRFLTAGDDDTVPSIIRPQIIRDAVGLVEVVPVVGIAVQQRTGLRLVIGRDVVRLIDRLGEDIAIILVVRLRADEDADAVVRLGIEIAHVVAGAMNHEAMRRQRVQRLLARFVIGDLDAEAGRREIKTVLVEERLARRFQRHEQRGAQQ